MVSCCVAAGCTSPAHDANDGGGGTAGGGGNGTGGNAQRWRWVIVVDEDCDVRNWNDVMWRVVSAADPDKDGTLDRRELRSRAGRALVRLVR